MSKVTLYRWQRDPALKLPQPATVRGHPLTNIKAVERWMEKRVVVLNAVDEVA